MSKIEPRHDTSMCACGAPLQPAAYFDGMLRPDGDFLPMSMLRCVSTGVEFRAGLVRVIQAWWSVGAHEQYRIDDNGCFIANEPNQGRVDD